MHQIRNCEPFRAVTFIDVSGDTSPSVLRLEVHRCVRFSGVTFGSLRAWICVYIHAFISSEIAQGFVFDLFFASPSPRFSNHKYIEYSHIALTRRKTKRNRVCLPPNHVRSIRLKYEVWFMRMVCPFVAI